MPNVAGEGRISRPSRTATPDRRADDGFILPMLGLLIIPIVAFAALAIDVSSWYSRATELQRTADAAALGGVVWMPQLAEANTAAETVLARNGVDGSDPDISVTKEEAGDYSYKVCVTDASVTQFFGSMFADATTITRCAVAKYDEPLQIGSPLNFIGGANPGDFPDDPGHPAIPEQLPYGPADTPPNDDYSIDPTNYDTAELPWGNAIYWGGGNWVSDTTQGCKATTGSSSGHPTGYWWDRHGNRHGSQTNWLDNDRVIDSAYYYQSGWQELYADNLPDCVWELPGQPAQPAVPGWETIQSDMNPGYWLAIEAPGTDAVQGDRYAPKCYGEGMPDNCASNHPNPDYDENGHYFQLKINSSNPTSIQVLDAEFKNVGQLSGTGDNTLFNAGTWATHYEVLAPDDTPFDPTDNPPVGAAGCGNGVVGNSTNSGKWEFTSTSSYPEFENKWRTICTLAAPDVTGVGESGYILRVWSTGEGNASNNFALRGLATVGAATMPFPNNYPTNLAPQASQPSFSPWRHMAIYVNVSNVTEATFFITKVTPNYAGKTLVLELYDAAEGAQTMTVNNPFGVQKGCRYEGAKLRPGESGNHGYDGNSIGDGYQANHTIGPTQNCTIPTGGSTYNGVLLSVKMDIPTDYTCDEDVRPTSTSDSNKGCWWSITYNVSDPHDNTTWGAYIEGNPVRLIQ